MPVRDHPERPGTACRVVGALHCGDLADGKLEADAAAGGIASAAKPTPHVTAKMARRKVWATVMAVSQSSGRGTNQSNARGLSPRDWQLTCAGAKPPEHPRGINGANIAPPAAVVLVQVKP
jgi:hypothetical protein